MVVPVLGLWGGKNERKRRNTTIGTLAISLAIHWMCIVYILKWHIQDYSYRNMACSSVLDTVFTNTKQT